MLVDVSKIASGLKYVKFNVTLSHKFENTHYDPQGVNMFLTLRYVPLQVFYPIYTKNGPLNFKSGIIIILF